MSQEGEVEISTKDAAVASHFYGERETGIEDAFVESETRFSSLLRELESGPQREVIHHELRGFVWTLATRTRALRQQATEMLRQFTSLTLEAASTPDSPDALARRFRVAFEQRLDRELANRPQKERELLSSILDRAAGRKPGERRAEALSRLPLVQVMARGMIDTVNDPDFLARAGQDGQIQGLQSLLLEVGTPTWFQPARWEVVPVEKPLVLGDGCVFVTRSDGWSGSLLLANKEWDVLYFPISSKNLLVGYRESRPQLLTTEEVNQTSAALSWTHFFASSVDADTRAMATSIGDQASAKLQAEASAAISRLRREYERE